MQALAQAQLQAQMLAQQQAMLAAVPAAVQPAALVAAAALGSAAIPIAASAAGAAAAAPADDPVTRKRKEIYIGNLQVGMVASEMLEELFNGALAGMVPDAAAEPPVTLVKLDPVSGRFAFVEFRTEELATTALQLDRTELLGKPMNIGRPKGYVPHKPGSPRATNDTLAAAQQVAAVLLGKATNVLLLEGLVPAVEIREAEERQELSEMVYEEAVRCGRVLGIAVPLPPSDLEDAEVPCRVYVRFSAAEDAAKCKEMMDGRMFDDRKVTAKHTTELDYNRAAGGEWIDPNAPPPAPPAAPAAVPGLAPAPGMAPVPGLASAPSLAPAPMAIPGLASMPTFLPGLPGSAPLSIPALPGSAPASAPNAAVLGFPGAPPA